MAHIYSGLIDDAAFLVFFFKNNLDDDGGGDGDNNDDGKNTLRGIFMKDARQTTRTSRLIKTKVYAWRKTKTQLCFCLFYKCT